MFGVVIRFVAIICSFAIVQEQFNYFCYTQTSTHNAIVNFLFSNIYVGASEFPERECCDPVYPPPVPTLPSSSAATPTGRSGKHLYYQSLSTYSKVYIEYTIVLTKFHLHK